MLGINCGFGAADCAAMPQSALDLKNGWLTFPRAKTGIVRRCPLWRETVKALKAAIQDRPAAEKPGDEELTFLTVRSKRWVRDWITGNDKAGTAKGHHCDELGDEFKKLTRKAKIERSGVFYLLRHTFRTIADGSKDQPAVDHLMGHAADQSDMSARHRGGSRTIA